VAAEQQLEELEVNEHLMGHDGDVGEPVVAKQPGQLAADPAVTDPIAERAHNGARRVLMWAVDDEGVQSKSNAAIRPPLRVTRAISASARCSSGTCMSIRSVRQALKVASSKSSGWASPTRNSTGSRLSSQRRRASEMSDSLTSIPTTRPLVPTNRAMSMTSAPVPQPTSSTT
jgi:hypothetical protein